MRRLSQAGFALACAAASTLIVACGGEGSGDVRASAEDPEEERSWLPGPGSELMAQEAPPAVGRPVTGGSLGPRMDPDETPGRWPFYWTRAVYSGYGRGWGGYGRGGRGGSWATDYPKGDRQFLIVLKRLVRLNAYDWENAVSLADPDIRRFPVIYAVEVGRMDMTEEEVEGLRSYLDAGGFLIVDDFWGAREWAQFEYNIRRVFPNRPIRDLDRDHPIFSAYYDIEEILQVPNIGNGRRITYGWGGGWGGGPPTSECGPCQPTVRGIFDDDGRLMVVINWNTDLGDAWEWAEDPGYPLRYSTFAYELGTNMIVYAMSH
jgi:hypothetical protein